MKKIHNSKLMVIALIFLILPQQPALADSLDDRTSAIPVELFDKLLSAGNVLIESIKWPIGGEKLGFKDFSIGDSFNLNSGDVHAYTKAFYSVPRQGEIFNCRLDGYMPLVRCRMMPLQTAFGESVRLNFTVLLSRTLDKAGIEKNEFGAGRILSIEIENDKPSSDFLVKAKDFFSDKLNSKPKVHTTYKNATGIYSKKCIETISRIEKKPILALSNVV